MARYCTFLSVLYRLQTGKDVRNTVITDGAYKVYVLFVRVLHTDLSERFKLTL